MLNKRLASGTILHMITSILISLPRVDYQASGKAKTQSVSAILRVFWRGNVWSCTSEWNDKCTEPLKVNSKRFLNLKNISKWFKVSAECWTTRARLFISSGRCFCRPLGALKNCRLALSVVQSCPDVSWMLKIHETFNCYSWGKPDLISTGLKVADSTLVTEAVGWVVVSLQVDMLAGRLGLKRLSARDIHRWCSSKLICNRWDFRLRWPLNCATKLSGTSALRIREMQLFLTDWLVTLPCKPAAERNLPISDTTHRHLVYADVWLR